LVIETVIATIQICGRRLALRIPKSVAQQIRAIDGSGVELPVDEDGLVTRAARRRYRLSELVRKITPATGHGETDLREPAGKEAW
jgi:antitoxin component of MazEF toxin-antitoxin module